MIDSHLQQNELEKWWTLVDTTGIGSKIPYQIWSKAKGVFQDADFSLLPKRAQRIIEIFLKRDSQKVFSKLLIDCGSEISILAIDSAHYPDSLRALEAPPLFLFFRGDYSLLQPFNVAIVGTRHPDREGLALTEKVAQTHATMGHTIFSGGANGVDTCAHQTALNFEAKTVVVCPSGLRELTPRSNIELFDTVVDSGGLLISEYPPFKKARKFHFHRRNQILAALGDEVVVVRASRKSGTMITARAALKLKKPLFAVPGSPLDPTSDGCLELLASGDAQFFSFSKTKKPSKPKPSLNDDELSIYKALSTTCSLEELALRCGLDSHDLLSTLTLLEISGLVERDPRLGGYRRSS